jgi:hypothetical protein
MTYRRDTLSQAYHEAAHAVTAEALAPRSVLDVALFKETRWHDGAEGECQYVTDLLCARPVVATMVMAPRWAEKKIGRYQPLHHRGDDAMVETLVTPIQKSWASLQAKRLVHKFWDEIDRVARALHETWYLTGTQVRDVMAGRCELRSERVSIASYDLTALWWERVDSAEPAE